METVPASTMEVKTTSSSTPPLAATTRSASVPAPATRPTAASTPISTLRKTLPDVVGTIISTEETPNTGEFHFVIQGLLARKGQFVQVPTPSGALIGLITEISRANRYFERAESVAEYERLGVLTAQFPTNEWEYMVASVRVHGVLGENGHLIRASIPVPPGVQVLMADDEQLKSFLGIQDKGLELGTLAHHTLPVRLGLSRLLQKHLAILAMSGSGKSYLTGVLIEELLDRPAAEGRISVVVIDNHGEYAGFRDSQYRANTVVLEGKKLRIPLRRLNASKLAEWSAMSSVARRSLDKHFSALREKIKLSDEPLGLEDLIDSVRSDVELNKKENVRGPLLSALEELQHLRIIGKSDSFKARELMQPGKLIVFDLSDIDSLRVKQMIVDYYGRKLFRMRKKGEIPPYLLVVEEAHNFAREKAERQNALSKGVIEMIAREGRKFGASLCLITQRPVQLSTTALSQCVTPDTLVTRHDGYTSSIGEMAHSWAQSEVMSYEADQRARTEKSPSAYLAKNPKSDGSPVFELTTHDNRHIRATGDHPFWVEGKGWTHAKEITSGHRVAVRPLQEFDYELNAQERLLLSENEIQVPSPVRQHEIITKLRSRGLLPLTTASSKLPIIARLIGHIYGDGTLHTPYRTSTGQWLHRITFSGQEEELGQIKKDLARLGFASNQKVQHQLRESSANFIQFGPRQIRGVSTSFKAGFHSLWFLLQGLGAPIGDKSNQPALVPEWVMLAPRHIKREFLAAYLGSECSSIRFRKRWAESLHLPFCKEKSIERSGAIFADQIQSLLLEFGIESSRFSRPYCHRKDGTSSIQFTVQINAERPNLIRFCRRVGYRYSPAKEAVSLRALAFMEHIESLTARKQEVLMAVNSNVGHISPIQASQMGIQLDTARAWRTRGITKARLCPTDHLSNFEEWLAHHCEGLGDGLIWDAISSKNQVAADDVRDLTIPDTHCFFANGFLTHNCNTNIILRVTNPFDIKHIGESCEGIDSHMLNSITTLRVGEALIVGEAVGAPVFVSVRTRRSRTPPKGDSLEKLAKQFEDKAAIKSDEIEAFL